VRRPAINARRQVRRSIGGDAFAVRIQSSCILKLSGPMAGVRATGSHHRTHTHPATQRFLQPCLANSRKRYWNRILSDRLGRGSAGLLAMPSRNSGIDSAARPPDTAAVSSVRFACFATSRPNLTGLYALVRKTWDGRIRAGTTIQLQGCDDLPARCGRKQ
jgi:hypothetical protein